MKLGVMECWSLFELRSLKTLKYGHEIIYHEKNLKTIQHKIPHNPGWDDLVQWLETSFCSK